MTSASIAKISAVGLLIASIACCACAGIMGITPSLVEVPLADGTTATSGMGLLFGLDLLIIPLLLLLIGGAVWFIVLPELQAKATHDDTMNRLRDVALALYLDQMVILLLEKNLRAAEPGADARASAQSRTLAVLSLLDGAHKRRLLQFLYDSNLITGEAIVSLHGADLRGADLRDADLRGADLRGADLLGARLDAAKLSEANLRGTRIAAEQLAVAASLVGAIMPDGRRSE